MSSSTPPCSPTRIESCSLEHESGQSTRFTNTRTPLSASTSFFIIQEPTITATSPNGGSRSPPKLRRDERDSRRTRHEKVPSSGLKKKKSRSKTPTSAKQSPLAQTVRTNVDLRSRTSSPLGTSSGISSVVYEGHEGEEVAAAAENEVIATNNTQIAASKKRPVELSILNRCGSAPELPLYSPVSASVYSSSKKRTLQVSTNGASPHLAMLQRSRLTPLPVNPRTGPVKNDPKLDDLNELNASPSTLTIIEEQDLGRLCPKDPLHQEKLHQDAQTIALLKQRLVLFERQISASTKYRHTSEKQIAQLTHENNQLYAEKTQQQARIEELDNTVLRQRHEYDKLAARYASVYANLQKLADQQQLGANKSTLQTALQALARENQDFLRKLRVLEARHVEDKTLTSNQEKKIKRLRAEKEALQHMNEANTREEEIDEFSSEAQHHSPTTDQVSRLVKPNKRSDSDNNQGGRPSSASSSTSLTSSTPRTQLRPGSSARLQVQQSSAQSTGSHLVSAEAYQYIDPNILKVLEKVDSQFSITNAINLSVVLKKWLNSCVHIVCSTHLPTVLQTLLKRICELLHCEHAALFSVDHAARKLISVCSEHGAERWELPLDKGIAGYAARHNTICNVHRASDDPRFYSSTDSITCTMSREVLALPIVHELQHQLEAHLLSGGGSSRMNLRGMGVFAVLRVWNTTHQKPFSPNDQVLGTLLSIQAGIILRQNAVTKTLQKINHKIHQILQMPSEIVVKASSIAHATAKLQQANEPAHSPMTTSTPAASSPPSMEYSSATPIPSVVQLVATAQKELAGCLGVRQLRIFILDANALQLWHVGENMSPHDTSSGNSPTAVRHYVNAQASLCALVLHNESKPLILKEPSAEAAFNDTVDIPGGARGLYLAPIPSPWGSEALPFGMIQVARVAKARLSASPFVLTMSEGAGSDIVVGSAAEAAVGNEREAAQQTEDRLMLELLGLFCRVFAGLLHHVAGQQLYDTCPPEIQQAQLASLINRLDSLAVGRAADDENEDNNGTLSKMTADSTTDPRDASSRHSRRRTSLAVSHTNMPPIHNVRRVASADPKNRSPINSQRISTMSAGSPLKIPYPSRSMNNEIPGTWSDAKAEEDASHGLQNSEDWPGVPERNPENENAVFPTMTGIDPDIVATLSGGADENGEEHTQDAASTHENVQLDVKQTNNNDEVETSQMPFDSMAPVNMADDTNPQAEDWNSTLNAGVYSSEFREEQTAREGTAGHTWEEGGAYPTLWSAESQDTYDEAALGEFRDVAPGTADSDDASKHSRSHISTNSSYAIELGNERLSSRNTSSAESCEPNGAL